MIIYIYNHVYYHYEILETIINKYEYIIQKQINNPEIYLDIYRNDSFEKYIKSKYPLIIIKKPNTFDYAIDCTLNSNNYDNIKNLDLTKHFFISHDINLFCDSIPNILYLTPLSTKYIYCDILPFSNQKIINKNYPIFCIQGGINNIRRYYVLLHKILEKKYKYDFRIKIVGKGMLDNSFDKYIDHDYKLKLINNNSKKKLHDSNTKKILLFNNNTKKNINDDTQISYNYKKIIQKNNLEFIEYHNEFLDCFCIIPLISKKTHPHYYTTKLTSTINYIKGYQLKCLIDKDLQNIYDLDNVEIYNDENDIIEKFEKILNDFYNKTIINLIFFSRIYNFGDHLSKFICNNLINKSKYEVIYNDTNCNINIIVIGSYIHEAPNNCFIFGSGIRTDPPIENKHNYNNLNVSAVRGPLTRNVLINKNINVPEIYGDPALLLPKFYTPNKNIEYKNKIGLIPHYTQFNKYSEINDDNILLINPTDNWKNVIDKLVSCKYIISSSLHGLICADAYNIPNVWLDEYQIKEGDFKFKDYFASQNRPYIKIKKIDEFNESFLYKDGNKIDLDKLINSFPFK